MREGGEGLKGLAEPECQSVRTVEAVIFYLSRLRGKGEGCVVEWVDGEGGRDKRDGRARLLEAYRTVETGSVFSDRDDVTFWG